MDFDFDEEKKANPVDLFIYKPPGPPGRRKVSSGVNGFLSDYLIQLIDCSVLRDTDGGGVVMKQSL